MNAATGHLLSVHGLTVSYPAGGSRGPRLVAARNISLDIGPGRILALVGESGSGKTSVARAILQLLPIEAGQVLLHGEDLTAMAPQRLRQARRHIQAVFQDPLASLSPRRTVIQTLLEPLDHFGLGTPAERAGHASAILDQVGLDVSLLHRLPHELSGGQRQRVAFARAIAAKPDLIVADEPVSSLDLTLQARIIDLILDLRDRLGISFLFVTHDLAVVRRLADDVAVMYAGQIVESASARSLFERPAHPYTRALLAAIPAPDPRQARPRPLPGESPGALTRVAGCVFHGRCPDRFGPCESAAPAASRPPGPDPNHRVRCHLCLS